MTQLVVGCAYLQELVGVGVERPEVRLVGLEVKGAWGKELGLEAVLEVTNRNRFEIRFSRLVYDIQVDGDVVASGTFQGPVSITAFNQQRIRLPVKLHLGGSLDLLRRVVWERRKLLAQWQAEAFFHSPIGKWKVSTSDQRYFQ